MGHHPAQSDQVPWGLLNTLRHMIIYSCHQCKIQQEIKISNFPGKVDCWFCYILHLTSVILISVLLGHIKKAHTHTKLLDCGITLSPALVSCIRERSWGDLGRLTNEEEKIIPQLVRTHPLVGQERHEYVLVGHYKNHTTVLQKSTIPTQQSLTLAWLFPTAVLCQKIVSHPLCTGLYGNGDGLNSSKVAGLSLLGVAGQHCTWNLSGVISAYFSFIYLFCMNLSGNLCGTFWMEAFVKCGDIFLKGGSSNLQGGSRILVRGVQRSFDPRGGPCAQNLLIMGVFPMLPENCMILNKSWRQAGARRPGPPGSAGTKDIPAGWNIFSPFHHRVGIHDKQK